MNTTSPSLSPGSEEAVAAIFSAGSAVIFLFISGIMILLSIVMIIISGIPYYKMAKKVGLSSPWLAFVPFANVYVMTVIPKKEFQFYPMEKTIENRTTVFWFWLLISLVLPFICGIFSLIPLLGIFVALIASSFIGIFSAYYSFVISLDIWDTFSEEHTTNIVMCVISIFIPILSIIYAYILCGKDPVFNYVTGVPTYGAPKQPNDRYGNPYQQNQYGNYNQNGGQYGNHNQNGGQYGNYNQNGAQYGNFDQNNCGQYGNFDQNGGQYGNFDSNNDPYHK